MPSADCCHWNVNTPADGGVVRAVGVDDGSGATVSARPSVGVVSLIVGAPVGASLTFATGAVGAENTVSSTPLASW